MNEILEEDKARYSNKKEIPLFQVFFRKLQSTHGLIHSLYKICFRYWKKKNHVELYEQTMIGGVIPWPSLLHNNKSECNYWEKLQYS